MAIYKDNGNVIALLFDQIHRVTKSEGGMTFTQAMANLMNVLPAGDLPIAEKVHLVSIIPHATT